MALADYFTWLSLGRPSPGQITIHHRPDYSVDEAADLARRLKENFGDLERLRLADLGCGACETLVGSQVLKIPFRRLISVEAFIPYIHQLKTKDSAAQQHDILEGRIESIVEDFRLDDIDVVLLVEVLEHFRRKEALKLLARLEKICRKGIVLFSPLGAVHREEPRDQNALQRYRSNWEADDFARLGYSIEVYEDFYDSFKPPASAAWAIKKCGIRLKPNGESAKAA